MDAIIFSSMACGADSLRTPFICLSAALDPVRDEKKNTSFSSRYLFFVCDFMILCTGYFFPI